MTMIWWRRTTRVITRVPKKVINDALLTALYSSIVPIVSCFVWYLNGRIVRLFCRILIISLPPQCQKPWRVQKKWFIRRYYIYFPPLLNLLTHRDSRTLFDFPGNISWTLTIHWVLDISEAESSVRLRCLLIRCALELVGVRQERYLEGTGLAWN